MKRTISLFLWMVLYVTAANAASIKDFARAGNVRDIDLSPDGTHLAMVVPSERSTGEYDKTELRIVDLTRNQITAVLNFSAQTSVLDVRWVNHERVMVSAGRRIGGRDGKFTDGNIVMVNRDGSKQETVFGPDARTSFAKHLTQQDYADMEVLDLLPGETDNILIYKSYWRNSAGSEANPGVTRLNVYTGKQNGFERVPFPEAKVWLDGNQVVRFAQALDEDGGTRIYYRDNAQSEFREVARFAVGEPAWSPVHIDRQDGTLFILSDIGRKNRALMTWEPASGKQTLVVADEHSDIAHFFYGSEQNGKRLLAVHAADSSKGWVSLGDDAPELQLLQLVSSAFKGLRLGFVSVTDDGRKGLISISAENRPREFYVVDAQKKTANVVARVYPWLKSAELATTREITIKARDGLDLPSLLTLPHGAEKQLPLVLLVHGGPFGMRDVRGFDDEVQLLAHQGYGVLQVNFRGSGGYGSAFEKAGYGQYGAAMQDDLVDATRWAIQSGVADPQRICIMGHSYGGYAAVWGAMRDSGLYRCVVASMGVYDLPLRYEEGECQLNAKCIRLIEQMMGKDSERLKAVSPVHFSGEMKTPVLLVHGDHDKRVPIEHAHRMRQTFTAKGTPFEWMELPGSGHGFASESVREAFYERLVRFLSTHLKVNAMPAGVQ